MMRAERISDTNFQGNLYIQNKLSIVADSRMKKVAAGIEEFIASKKYDLYVQQDYGYNNVNFIASQYAPSDIVDVYRKISIPVISKHSKYTEAAKKATENYEKAMLNEEQKQWERQKKQRAVQDMKDIAESIVFLPLFMIYEILHEINPKWSNKFERFLDRI